MIKNEFVQNLFRILVLNAGELLVFGLLMILLQMLFSAHKEQKMWDRSSSVDVAYSFILSFCSPFFYLVPMIIVARIVQLNPAMGKMSAPGFITGTTAQTDRPSTKITAHFFPLLTGCSKRSTCLKTNGSRGLLESPVIWATT